MNKILQVLFLSLCIPAAYAQDDETMRYYQAYNACSPKAQNQAMAECHYAQIVEGYYISCMAQNGYGEFDTAIEKGRYPDYLQTYRQCTNIANSAAQQQCNYVSIHKKYYEACMYERGFNADGEPTNQQQNNTTAGDKAPDSSKTPNNSGGPITRFLESIL